MFFSFYFIEGIRNSKVLSRRSLAEAGFGIFEGGVTVFIFRGFEVFLLVDVFVVVKSYLGGITKGVFYEVLYSYVCGDRGYSLGLSEAVGVDV